MRPETLGLARPWILAGASTTVYCWQSTLLLGGVLSATE